LWIHTSNNYQETGRFWTPRYVRDYATAIGLPHKTPWFDELVEIFGEPCSTDFSGTHPSARFGGLSFIFTPQRSETIGGAQAITILDSTIRLGRRQIGVGSTRVEVEHAYRRFNIVEVSDEDVHMLMIVDGITWLRFHLDEDDKVTHIDITFYGP